MRFWNLLSWLLIVLAGFDAYTAIEQQRPFVLLVAVIVLTFGVISRVIDRHDQEQERLARARARRATAARGRRK